MTQREILTDKSREKDLVGPQEDVLEDLFLEENNVIVSAGAGTGKTTTMVEAVTEAVLRENDHNKNPFEKVLVVTFTVEAARQLQQKVLERLINHLEDKGDCETDIDNIKRQVENESWILTLDKFTRKILNQEMIEAGIGSIDEVTDDYELHNVRNEVMSELRNSSGSELQKAVEVLQDWAPKTRFNRTENNHWEAAIWNVLRDGRQLSMSAEELMREAWRSFKEDIFLNYNPKNDLDDEEKEKIKNNLTGVNGGIEDRELVEIYNEYKDLLASFEKVLLEAEEIYDNKTKSEGKLTYDDVRYHILNHIEENEDGDEFRKNRFDYVFVDEFQDTSHAQCDLLRAFISDETRVALIGDPRQSIYQWREADPNIFSQMVDKLDEGDPLEKEIEKFRVSGFDRIDLDENFRSNDSIVELTNNLFGDKNDESIFKQDKYLEDINLPNNDLETCEDREKAKEDKERETIHLHRSQHSSTEDVARDWAREICRILSNIEEYKIFEDVENDDVKWRNAELGDCWILMRSRGKWQYLKDQLTEHNIDYIFVNQKGLFEKSPSVQIIIDILNWIGNPHDFESLARIVRSPLLGLEDKTLRYIASKEFDLDWIEDEDSDFISDRDIDELKELVKLREDLRWKREDRKSELVESILQFSAFDVVSLTATEGRQELGNIRQFQQVIDDWENEELMSFQDFIDRINFYRDFGAEEGEFNFAPLAEQEERDSVKITTVHSAKGLGYPIVFHYNPDRSISYNLLSLSDNDLDLIIKRKRNPSNETFVSIGLNYLESFNEEAYFNEDEGRSHSYWGFRDANAKIESIENQTRNEVTNIFDEYRIFNQWAEEWRLLYVALTRAEDHIFLPFKESPGERYSWEKVYHEMDDEGLLLEDCNYEEDLDLGEIDFDFEDLDLPDLNKKSLDNYVPISVSISHLYDLIVCPRRYQYIQLQSVSGPSDCEGVSRPEGVIFGNGLHTALETSDLGGKEVNTDFVEKMTDEIEEAVKEFYNSDIYDKYKFGDREILTEEEISYPFQVDDNDIILQGKIDCLMEGEDGLVVIDYKTANPSNTYEKEHQKYQLLGYSYLLEKLYPEIGVSKAVLLYYDRRSKEWNDEEVSLELDRFEEELEDSLPVELDDEGLTVGDEPPCEEHDGEEYCSEVIRLCKGV